MDASTDSSTLVCRLFVVLRRGLASPVVFRLGDLALFGAGVNSSSSSSSSCAPPVTLFSISESSSSTTIFFRDAARRDGRAGDSADMVGREIAVVVSCRRCRRVRLSVLTEVNKAAR